MGKCRVLEKSAWRISCMGKVSLAKSLGTLSVL